LERASDHRALLDYQLDPGIDWACNAEDQVNQSWR